MSSVRGVLFDWRGTLVRDPEIKWWLQTAFARLGPMDKQVEDWSDLASRVDAASRVPEIAMALEVADCSAADHRVATMMMLRHAGLDNEFAAAVYELDFDPDSHPFFPDLPELLRQLKERNIAIAVLSDVHFDLRPEFVLAGVADFIDVFVLSFEHGIQKPGAAFFLRAVESLGIKPHEALMVGDLPGRDGAAAAVGIPSLIVPAQPEGRAATVNFLLGLCNDMSS